MFGNVTPRDEGWRYKTLVASGEAYTWSSSVDYDTCFLAVPFPHVLRRAEAWFADLTNGDTDDIELFRALDGGSAVQEVADETWGDSSNKIKRIQLGDINESEEVEPCMYFLRIAGDNTDEIVKPSLAVMVSPIPPGPA